MMKQDDNNQAVIYQGENGEIILKQDVQSETIWANKKQIANIFGIDRSVVSRHIKNIFQDEELNQKVVCAKFAYTTQHGAVKEKTQSKLVEFYSLDIFKEDAYKTIEEKAAHLLYFIIKNHPFNDGNKRSGAFAFIWFLRKAGFYFQQKITPETLATLTILIAESNPKEKDKIIGIILLLLNFEK